MMDAPYRFPDWFLHHWARAALPLALVLLALGPLLLDALGLAAFLVYLQLPVYMLHQYEEHARGAFKEAANRMRGDGREVFTDANILGINLVLVWVTFLILLYAARYVDPALGLVPPYGVLLNGLLHLGTALRQRRPNPGLRTSVLLFLPVGGGAIYGLGRLGQVSPGAHLLGLGGAIVLHLIVGVVVGRTGRRSAAAGTAAGSTGNFQGTPMID